MTCKHDCNQGRDCDCYIYLTPWQLIVGAGVCIGIVVLALIGLGALFGAFK